jgi:hypothetical protein
LEVNRDAFDDYNARIERDGARIERDGLTLAQYRRF